MTEQQNVPCEVPDKIDRVDPKYMRDKYREWLARRGIVTKRDRWANYGFPRHKAGVKVNKP